MLYYYAIAYSQRMVWSRYAVKKLKRKVLKLASNNTVSFNERKAIEELAELIQALVQKHTKAHTKNPITTQHIIDEIGDAQRVIWWLTEHYGKEAVELRIKTKLEQLKKRFKEYETN